MGKPIEPSVETKRGMFVGDVEMISEDDYKQDILTQHKLQLKKEIGGLLEYDYDDLGSPEETIDKVIEIIDGKTVKELFAYKDEDEEER